MRAILIDPVERRVAEVDYDGNFRSIYKFTHCDCFTVATTFKNNDALYVDDEGLLKPVAGWFTVAGGHQPFAGYGLVVGTTRSGADCAARSVIEELGVEFLDRAEIMRRYG